MIYLRKEFEQVWGTGILVPPANTCQATFVKYAPDGYKIERVDTEFADRACRIDYLNSEMVDTLESGIDCSSRCMDKIYDYDDPDSDEAQAAAEECEQDCHNMIKEYSKGSFRVRETGEVIEANIPLTIVPFMTEDEDTGLAEGWESKVADKFADIGCRPDYDVGFRHPHEFASTTAGTEPDEDPAAFALHIRGGDRGRCMLPDVLNVLRELSGKDRIGKGGKPGRLDYIFEGLQSEVNEL